MENQVKTQQDLIKIATDKALQYFKKEYYCKEDSVIKISTSINDNIDPWKSSYLCIGIWELITDKLEFYVINLSYEKEILEKKPWLLFHTVHIVTRINLYDYVWYKDLQKSKEKNKIINNLDIADDYHLQLLDNKDVVFINKDLSVHHLFKFQKHPNKRECYAGYNLSNKIIKNLQTNYKVLFELYKNHYLKLIYIKNNYLIINLVTENITFDFIINLEKDFILLNPFIDICKLSNDNNFYINYIVELKENKILIEFLNYTNNSKIYRIYNFNKNKFCNQEKTRHIKAIIYDADLVFNKNILD